jgi:hypothetical protein
MAGKERLMAHLAEVTRSPVPAEAFEKYPNQWIALRNGEVVAAADAYAELMAHPSVKPDDDAFFHVPSSATYFY